MPRPQSRVEQKVATRERLLRLARRVFVRHGYDATSIALVCREARVTHGALYHHFPSKDALFAAVVEEVFVEVGERVRLATEGPRGWAQVEAASNAYLDACTDPEVQLFLFRDGPRVLAREAFDSIDHAVNAPLVNGLIERWMAQGLLAPRPVTFLARTLGAAFAEAGLIIREAEAPAHARAQVGALLSTWISTLRRSSATSTSLATERLILRPWESEDEEALAILTAHADIRRFLFDGKPPTRAWIRRQIRLSSEAFDDGRLGLWLARQGDEVVGLVGFQGDAKAPRDFVVATVPTAMRRGYAREMSKAALQEANARELRVGATVDAANAGSYKLLEQLGFVSTGRHPGPLGELVEFVLPFGI